MSEFLHHGISRESEPRGRPPQEELMKRVVLASLFLAAAFAQAAQDKAAVQMDKSGPFHPGDPIAFTLKLNEPMPKGAHMDLRIAPVSGGDQEIDLGAGEAIDATHTEFLVKGNIPDGALPGDWHIGVIYLFLSGSGWTHNTILPNDVKFQVQAKPYAIPTKADVTVGR